MTLHMCGPQKARENGGGSRSVGGKWAWLMHVPAYLHGRAHLPSLLTALQKTYGHHLLLCWFFMGGDGVVIDGQDNTCGLVPSFACKKNDDRRTKKWGAEQIRHPQRQSGLRFVVM